MVAQDEIPGFRGEGLEQWSCRRDPPELNVPAARAKQVDETGRQTPESSTIRTLRGRGDIGHRGILQRDPESMGRWGPQPGSSVTDSTPVEEPGPSPRDNRARVDGSGIAVTCA